MTKPPDSRTVLPGQPVGYHNEIDAALASYEKTRRLDAQLIKRVGADFAGKVLDVIASPAGRQTIAEALASVATEADRSHAAHIEIAEQFDALRDDLQRLHDDADRVLDVLRGPAGRAAIAEALRSPLMLKPDGTWREADGGRVAPRIEIANNLVPDSVMRAFETPAGKEILRKAPQRRPVFCDRDPDPSILTRDADGSLVAPQHPDGCRCTDCCRRKFGETKTWGQAPSTDGNPWAPTVSAVTDLRPGLYELTFKGGYTALASVGLLRDGRRWFAVATRVGEPALDAEHVACDDWSDVLCARLLRLAEGDGR